MRHTSAIFAAGLALSSAAQAATFESGDWGAAKVGHACHLFSTRAARHTSGALVLTFYQNGYNASFGYDYHPWPGETGAPWGEEDYPMIAFDDETSWLGDEMFTGDDIGGYGMFMTDGMVPEVITSVKNAKQSVDILLDRSTQNEEVILGRFSPEGFAAALQKASEWCAFDPDNLPSS